MPEPIEIRPYEFWEQYAHDVTKDPEGKRWELYNETVMQTQDLAPHVYREVPSVLIGKQRPNEPKEIFDYRVSIWEAVTNTQFIKIFNVISRVFNPGNFFVEHKKDPAGVPDGDFRRFTDENFWEFDSVLNYTKDVLLRFALGDANGWLVYDDILVVEGQFSMPKPYVFASKDVIDFRHNEWLFVKTSKKSEVRISVDGLFAAEGCVYWLVTKSGIIEIRQVGLKSENKFEAVERVQHNLDYLIARPLKGTSVIKNNIGYYESFVYPITPDWNKAINFISDLDGHLINHLFPKYAQLDIPCSECRGSMKVLNGDGERVTCGGCKGTGLQGGGTGPYASLMIPPEMVGKVGVGDIAGYISPPENIIKQAEEKISALIMNGFKALNMEVVGNTSSNVSAEKVALDRQDLNAFLKNVSQWAFDLLVWQYWVIGALRYNTILRGKSSSSDFWKRIGKEIVPKITRSPNVEYSTLDTTLEEIIQANEAKMPFPFLYRLQIKAAAEAFGEGSETFMRIKSEMELDPFPGITPDGILALQSTQTVNPLEFFVHFNIQRLVDLAIEQKKDFLFMPMPDKRRFIVELAKSLVTVPPSPPPVE